MVIDDDLEGEQSATIASTEYVKIDGCLISNNHREGFQVIARQSPAVQHVTIVGNTISANGAEAICLVVGGIEYVDVIENTLADNMALNYYGEIATWGAAGDKHCKFSQNNFTLREESQRTLVPIKFENAGGSNEGIDPPMINSIAFGYDETAGENVWSISFTAHQDQQVFSGEAFRFEVYASNVAFEYDGQGQVTGYGAGDFVYLVGCDLVQPLTGLQGSFTATVPASDLPPGFSKFAITATCVDRNDTSVFSNLVETPPQVVGVSVGSGSVTETFAPAGTAGPLLTVPAADSDAQLWTVRVPTVTTVSITFSRDDIQTDEDALTIVSRDEQTTIAADDVSWSFDGYTATWTLDSEVPAGEWYVVLDATGVLTPEGTRLDGEWTNPEYFGEIGGNSEFPSGNGVADGDFQFAFTILPGDATRDGIVDAVDLGRLSSHWHQTGTWEDGDFNGDAYVDAVDLGRLSLHWYYAYWQPPEEMGMRGGGDDDDLRASQSASIDAVFAKYDVDRPAAAKSSLLIDSEAFDEFVKDLFDVLCVAI
jgi:hypothetical protein